MAFESRASSAYGVNFICILTERDARIVYMMNTVRGSRDPFIYLSTKLLRNKCGKFLRLLATNSFGLV